MAKFITELAKKDKIKLFIGGTKSEREHLNNVVQLVNEMIDLAKQDAQDAANGGANGGQVPKNDRKVTIMQNGARIPVLIAMANA